MCYLCDCNPIDIPEEHNQLVTPFANEKYVYNLSSPREDEFPYMDADIEVIRNLHRAVVAGKDEFIDPVEVIGRLLDTLALYDRIILNLGAKNELS